ncbi:phosphopantetheinyl transferase [Xylariaceae sp. FL0255]|nr:phosphopantetheinyl transferase [Xylariaceae sp. FL0255]
MSSGNVEIIQYLVDTRKLWPGALKTADLVTHAMRELALLTPEERLGVLKYYFVADAKMSLVSRLLKHWVVARYAGVPWLETKMSADANKKPIFLSKDGKTQPVVFNVSHQAGIVALVGAYGYDNGKGDGNCEGVQIGTDIVCTSERQRRDLQMIRDTKSGGWGHFVDMHADVFGRAEAGYLKTGLTSLPTFPSRGTKEEKELYMLRAFYMLWCLREAYVKMTGEALLAEWLGDLVFQDFEPPAPQPEGTFVQRKEDEDGDAGEIRGQVVRRLDVHFKGKKVEDANICLRSLGADFMTCTAVRTPDRKEDALGWELGPYEWLDLETILHEGEN